MLVGNKRGMTLVEVMVALFILSVCVLPVYSSLLMGKKQVESAEKKAVALEMAQGILEEVMSRDYSAINDLLVINNQLKAVDAVYNYTQALDLLSQGRQNDLLPTAGTAYSYTVDVSSDNTYPNTMKIISVTVYYTEAGSNVQKSVQITGARTKR
ncbi:prepilin-type N-terminal cleavage/methylation domain-containing protein [Desulfoscipio geothermicus]|uniref:Prepilin-type N-terminal cleavage/methylation domain-containing protein n=1 Tax=Desulfoscipio geothermicus DSM 3669 TaxID=1121426 RepID=A0A1I6DBX8_9FIRM|nr:prepilin-type N-terminal cleavage/methylation domain-containing protein [Desulfoscipio geothermicus]SFR02861.1 prepilin-type N-terminal cleavage/methylation domain-containing protein [Desulfoscipio geothermicus DSM 3669]